jgi:hypothetical protein
MRTLAAAALLTVLLSVLPSTVLAAEYGATYAPAPVGDVVASTWVKTSVKVTNTGTLTWNKAFPYATNLVYHWSKKGETAWIPSGPFFSYLTMPLAKPVAPGETVTIGATFIAPNDEGSYVLRWDLSMPDVKPSLFSARGVPMANQPVTVVKTTISPTAKLGDIVKSGTLTLATLPVTIDNVVGAIEPETDVVIEGTGFSGAPGTAALMLKSPAIGEKSYALTVVEWNSKYIYGTLPKITGVPDMLGTIQVVTKDGRASAFYSVAFTAAREYIKLPAKDVGGDCSRTSDEDFCQGKGTRITECWGPGPDTFGTALPDSSYYAEHSTHECVSCNSGTDSFGVTLKNGWVFDYTGGESVAHRKASVNLSSAAVTSGATSAVVNMPWSTGYCAWVSYWLDFHVTGPAGVSYK